MAKHYQDIVDEVFGHNFRHRTLRTLFDPMGSEWRDTSMDQKVHILKKLLASNKITLEEIIDGYTFFYSHELKNKRHVLSSLDDGLAILLPEAGILRA